MTWTKDKPTIPGFYWHRSLKEPASVVWIANYFNQELRMYTPGTDESWVIEDGEEWIGPLRADLQPVPPWESRKVRNLYQ